MIVVDVVPAFPLPSALSFSFRFRLPLDSIAGAGNDALPEPRSLLFCSTS